MTTTMTETTRVFFNAMTGEQVLELPASVHVEQARWLVARKLRHTPRGTHLLEPTTGRQILREWWPSEGEGEGEEAATAMSLRCGVLLARSYRVACGGCGCGLDCTCGLYGDVARGCQCGPSALASDREAVCTICEDLYASEGEEDDQQQ
jgi:hypothetical protein